MASVTDVKRQDVLTVQQEPTEQVEIAATGLGLRAVNARLRGASPNGPIRIKDVAGLSGLAAGLEQGELLVDGQAGDYLAALNDGASIRVEGDVGCYLADNMTRGTVVVGGSAGHGAAPYCYGGVVVIKGDAGDFTAVMNKGATVIVGGDVGNDVATYMLDGDVIVVGDAGENLGNYLIRGSIYVGGEWKSLGHNTRLEVMTPDDVVKLQKLFKEYGIDAEPSSFRKVSPRSEKPFYKSESPAQAETPSRRT
jgi:glutamate synthase domain-containing protein 3